MRESVDEIQKSIEAFTEGLPEVEKRQFDKVYALLKNLSLDSEGHIITQGKLGLENLKIINRVKSQLASVIDLPIYQDKVVDLNSALSRVSANQTTYYSETFSGFTRPNTISKIQEIAFSDTVDSLVGSGVNENVVKESSMIVEKGIRDGANFRTMVDQLKDKMLGNEKVEPKLISYAKQVITDNLSGFARNYHAIVTNDLGLEWFVWVGALVASSRPVCIACVKKHFIHKSEFSQIARGVVDGVFVGTQGMFSGTTGENLEYRCGGHNCEHQLVPVPSSIVPKELRDLFESKEPQKN